MIPSEILRKKRLHELSKQEVSDFISGVGSGEVSREQVAGFLMAACINGLTPSETSALTEAMTNSGTRFDFHHLGKPIIDKHSTGGIGDKTSLLLAPILAECGVCIPMISGRGLGHTGGTVDKLESIVGFDCLPEPAAISSQMNRLGAVLLAQSSELAPADKILYSLRDVTGTVESIGLITASILSKKMAEGLDGLVMDVKVGNGAFMATIEEARELGDSLLAVADESDLRMTIVYSAMHEPLGRSAGNWLEVSETIEALGDFDHSMTRFPDLTHVVLELAKQALILAFPKTEETHLRDLVTECWRNGSALQRFKDIVVSQGGDLDLSRNRYLETITSDVFAERDGWVSSIDTRNVGLTIIELGGGRKKGDDQIDHSVGVVFHKKIGDYVSTGEAVATIYSNDRKRRASCVPSIHSCFSFSERRVAPQPLILSIDKNW